MSETIWAVQYHGCWSVYFSGKSCKQSIGDGCVANLTVCMFIAVLLLKDDLHWFLALRGLFIQMWGWLLKILTFKGLDSDHYWAFYISYNDQLSTLEHWYCTYFDQNNVCKGYFFSQSGAFRGVKMIFVKKVGFKPCLIKPFCNNTPAVYLIP